MENDSRISEEKKLGAEGEREKEGDQMEERKINEDKEEMSEEEGERKTID